MNDEVAEAIALVVITALIAYVSIVLGELTAKRLALQRAESWPSPSLHSWTSLRAWRGPLYGSSVFPPTPLSECRWRPVGGAGRDH